MATTLGVIGIVVAYRQLRDNRAAQRDATAIAALNDCLQLALQHPNLSLPQPYMTGAGQGNTDYKRYE